MDRIDDPAGLREEELVELEGRGDPVAGADDYAGSIEIVEAQIRDVGRYVVQEGASLASVGYEYDSAGLLYGSYDLLVVQRYHGVQVDDFGLHAVLRFQFVGSLYRAVERCAEGDDGNILTGADNVGVAELDLIALSGYAALVELLAYVIDSLALKDGSNRFSQTQ